MTTIDSKPVVVGVDGSDQSVLALDWAVDEAKRRGRPLELVFALNDTPYMEISQHAQRERAEEMLEQLADRARGLGALEVTTKCEYEAPVDAMLDASRTAELLVLGSRGHTIVGGWLIGSVSMHVSRHAACPVAVIRSPHDMSARRVVVGVDGSAPSEAALGFAFDEADGRGAPLLVIRAEEEPVRAVGLGLSPVVFVDEEEEIIERELADQVDPWREKYPSVTVTTDVRVGHPTNVLTDASLTASLVVVGSRGRGGFSGALMGSISQGVLHHSRTSVVVVR
jgi:nucleotide-binding universal stress UspA family protein